MKIHRPLTLFILFFSTHISYTQQDLPKIVPASPNAAALGKFGEIPIGLFTGTPNISIPIYEVRSRELTLPISVNYHSSGVKVEEIGSWVGLGWSLSANYSISRSVMGLPDEGGNGYFSHAVPISTLFSETAQYGQEQEAFIENALHGTWDTEPDIYQFSCGTGSGKFVYSQEDQRFYAIPHKAIKIEILNGETGWKLTDENGVNYYFTVSETNMTSSVCDGNLSQGQNNITSWYLKKMVNANQTDSIIFNYVGYNYSFTTIGSFTKEILPAFNGDCSAIPEMNSDCYTISQFQGVRLQSIEYLTGRVDFVVQTSDRCDLPGDKALQHIFIYDSNNELIKKVTFQYGYFNDVDQPLNCNDPNFAVTRRLKLKEIVEGDSTLAKSSHQFEYNESILPNRGSFAQDHWGYFNGATSNSHLVPTTYYVTASTGQVHQWTGANREANTQVDIAQAGMLTKITYPTKGYTTFEYENHRVNNQYVSPETISNFITQEGDGTGQQNLYQKTFSIDVEPSAINGYQSGAYVTFEADGITCSWTGSSSTSCAIFSVTGPTGYTFTESNQTVFLPNGSYTFTADFTGNSNVESFMEFYSRLRWQEVITPTASTNAPVGGLRIKRITDYDDFNPSNKVVRKFKYTLSSDTLKSSADFRWIPNYIREHVYQLNCDTDYGKCSKILRSSLGNYPTITASGSHVFYTEVRVLYGENGENGTTLNRFTTATDFVLTDFPFPQPTSYEWMKGHLSEKIEYKFHEGVSLPVAKQNNEYAFFGLQKASRGVKIAPKKICLDGTVFSESILANTHYAYYDVPTDIVKLQSSADTLFDVNNGITLTKLSSFTYSDSHFQVIKKEEIESSGEKTINYLKYPADYSNTGTDSASMAIMELKDRNMLLQPIESTQWKNIGGTEYLISANLNTFKKLQGIVVQDKVYATELSSPTSSFSPSSIMNDQLIFDSKYKSQLRFKDYDMVTGNLEGVQLADNVMRSYVWGYNSIYPIAEFVGANRTEVFHSSFEDSSGTVGESPTGDKYYNSTSYTIPVADRPTGTNLVMTYWYYDGSWKFQDEVGYNPIISKPGATRYDEIRVYPKGAEMTTYTYKPGIGIASMTDTNNVSSYYEYDSLGRLKLIKDDKGNVLQHYTYNYKQN